jgi:hypothetical protein
LNRQFIEVFSMEYRGKQYLIFEGDEPNSWRWAVTLDDLNTRTGETKSRAVRLSPRLYFSSIARCQNRVDCRLDNSGWHREFDEPIPLPDGRRLFTLRDAAGYITGLPRKKAALTKWQAAIESLMLVVEHGGPTMFARIGILRAQNRGHVRELNPDSEDHHWGRRKSCAIDDPLMLNYLQVFACCLSFSSLLQ